MNRIIHLESAPQGITAPATDGESAVVQVSDPTSRRLPNYKSLAYDTKARFNSFWHQISEVVGTDPDSVLEVGVGSGFTSNYLRRMGISITSLDIDPSLDPDMVASVLDLPYPDGTFDTVTCFEVLEHLPFEHFKRALSELYRVARSTVILSLPDSSRVYRVALRIPAIHRFRWLI
ncbi:MAG: class I SAM-dependent methyltransferase, partial [Chloroflexi bacterium]|nr:class I SAM-dependent methyltransferase [Chloroflexota bacterium]